MCVCKHVFRCVCPCDCGIFVRDVCVSMCSGVCVHGIFVCGVCVFSGVCACAEPGGGHHMSYFNDFTETGCLTEHGARMAASKPQGATALCSAGVAGERLSPASFYTDSEV